MKNFLAGVKTEYEAANPGSKVEILPIVAARTTTTPSSQLMMRSPNTAPDMVYEDTFLINSDITAGYLKPLDDYIKNWDDWSQFEETAKGAAKAPDGKTYGVPDGTDTRALWYNKQLFAKAGLPDRLAAEDLGRRAQRRPDDQAEAPRRHPDERLLGQADG